MRGREEIRHADRAVFFRPPAVDADLPNALTDAIVSTPPGKMLVYYYGRPGGYPARLRDEAMRLVSRFERHALVQWPSGPADRTDRLWCYAIQRPRA